jgi:hydrogenase maturation protease
METSASALILGIGNVLWADEGFGVRAVEAMQRQYEFPAGVTLMDGGTQGLYLVPYMQAAGVMVVFDAVDYGLPPGMLRRVEDEAVPAFLGTRKMSLHQTGFQEVLATAQMLGGYPQHLLLIGVQPEELEDYGGSLRPAVKAQIQPAVRLALDYLAEHGIVGRPRDCAHSPTDHATAFDMDRYESERPTETQALRVGDARVVLSGAFRIAPRIPAAEAGSLSVGLDHHLEKYR